MADVIALLQEGLTTLKSGQIPDVGFLKVLVSRVGHSVLRSERLAAHAVSDAISDITCPHILVCLLQVLGYAIVAGAGLLKVPQILGVLRSRSAQGLNLASFELENIGFSIHTAYGFVLGLPFSAFGEAVIILLQNTFLLAIIYYYARAPLWRAFLMIVLTAFGGWFVLSGEQQLRLNSAARKLLQLKVCAAMQELPLKRWSCLPMS